MYVHTYTHMHTRAIIQNHAHVEQRVTVDVFIFEVPEPNLRDSDMH